MMLFEGHLTFGSTLSGFDCADGVGDDLDNHERRETHESAGQSFLF